MEWGVCCKAPSAPNDWGDCYTENIRQSFDEDGALVGCAPLRYIVRCWCEKIFCFEEPRIFFPFAMIRIEY